MADKQREPVKYPKLPVTTSYFRRDGTIKRLYSSNPVRALMLSTGHLTLDHYSADLVHVYDSATGDLFFELVRGAEGVRTTYKCDPAKLDDPMRKKRRSHDILLKDQ